MEQWECYTGKCNDVRMNKSTELEKPQVVQLQYIVPTTKDLLGSNTVQRCGCPLSGISIKRGHQTELNWQGICQQLWNSDPILVSKQAVQYLNQRLMGGGKAQYFMCVNRALLQLQCLF